MLYSDVAATKDLTAEELVIELADCREKLASLRRVEYYLARALTEMMEETGATRLHTASHVVRLTRSVTYDTNVLARLREITDPLDLDGVYTAEHEEVRRVPERWNMVKGKKLLKLGNDHQAIIDDAKIFGNPKIEIYEKGDDIE